MPNLGGWEFVILIGILVLLFGAKRLPDMARSIGQSARVFKGEMKGMRGDEATDRSTTPPAAPAAPSQLPPSGQATPPAGPAASTSTPADHPEQGPRVTQPGHTQPGQ